MKTRLQIGARLTLFTSFFWNFLFSFFPLFLPSHHHCLLSAAPLLLNHYWPPGFSSASQGLWMNARLSLHSIIFPRTGMQKDRQEVLPPSAPPFPHQREVLWGRKAAKRSVYLFLNNGNVTKSHPGYLLILFYLMRKVKDRIPFTR